MKTYKQEERRKYYLLNIDKTKKQNKIWYDLNKKKCTKLRKKWYIENKESVLKCAKNRYDKNRKAWEGFIPKTTRCQVCGKKIYFNSKNKLNSIHFDHRHGERNKIVRPYSWLSSRKRTSDSEKEWRTFDFGLLCGICNNRLPTKNRVQFIENVLKYVKIRKGEIRWQKQQIPIEGN